MIKESLFSPPDFKKGLAGQLAAAAPAAAANLLSERLAAPLPGRQAQFSMAPKWRVDEWVRNPSIPADAKVACVLSLLYFTDGEWRVVLIERSINPHDRHSGQVSFPGGRYEESDGSLENVALREVEEEIGITADQIHLAGRLTELYIPVSHFLVHPFVGILKQPDVLFKPQPGEVENILLPSLNWLMQPEAVNTTDLTAGNGMKLTGVPYFDIEGRLLWGATAMILGEFFHL